MPENTINKEWMKKNSDSDLTFSQAWIKEGYSKDRVNRFKQKCHHPASQNLPDNPTIATADYGAYRSVLQEYKWHDLSEHNNAHPSAKKTDFIIPHNPNLGWKIHLNIAPEHVKEVSGYLQENGYNHKYLSGGELEDGKIFTVYIGSFASTTYLSQRISEDIRQHLAKPNNTSEVEFAPGIIGRFVAIGNTGEKKSPHFNQYGTCGYSFTDEAWNELSTFNAFGKNDPDYQAKQAIIKAEGERKSFIALKEAFGDYFYNDAIAETVWRL